MTDESSAWAALAAKHQGFIAGAVALFEQSVSVDARIARRAYQLLVEIHALGLGPPKSVELPALVWEHKTDNRVAIATITIRGSWWDGAFFSYDDRGTDKIGGAWTGTARSIALSIQRYFREGDDEG